MEERSILCTPPRAAPVLEALAAAVSRLAGGQTPALLFLHLCLSSEYLLSSTYIPPRLPGGSFSETSAALSGLDFNRSIAPYYDPPQKHGGVALQVRALSQESCTWALPRHLLTGRASAERPNS